MGFLRKLDLSESYRDILELPSCCELAVREKENKRYFFILNDTDRTQEIYGCIVLIK